MRRMKKEVIGNVPAAEISLTVTVKVESATMEGNEWKRDNGRRKC